MLADVSIKYLIEQVRAGAQVTLFSRHTVQFHKLCNLCVQILQVFETQGSPLNYEMFTKFSLPYLKKIAKGVKEGLKSQNIEPVPMVCKN